MSRILLTKNCIDNCNKTRRRPFQPDLWKDNVAKIKRNSGEQYISRKGVPVPAKNFIGQGKKCQEKCRHDGCNITDVEKADIHDKYWNMKSYELQRTYLAGLIAIEHGETKDRVKYFMIVNGVRLEVCQCTFLHVHGITQRIIRNVREKLAAGNLAISDGRGLHNNRPHRNHEYIADAMKAHLARYPVYENHYSRRKLGEVYLSCDLNVSLMFRQFTQTHQHIPNCDAKQWLFRKIFRESGLTIGQPKTDTCSRCDELFAKLKYSTEIDAQTAEEELIQHQVHSDKTYALMYEDIARSKSDPTYIAVCCDLQQVLFTPTLTHAEMYYSRQFSSYNFCVYNGATEQGYMYFWHEGEGKRGVDEISSALLSYVQDNFTPLENGQERTFTLWSDRCRGQNNNFQIICLLLYFIKMKFFTKVVQKFLCTGHSFLPCDRLFALIEKRKEVSMAYVPDDWIRILESAHPSKPFVVTRLNQEKIMKVKDYLDVVHFTRPTTLKVTEILHLEISAKEPSQILTRVDNNDGVWSCHVIPAPGQNGIRHTNRQPLDLNVLAIRLERKYLGMLELSEAKENDLRQMLKFLSPNQSQFYINLFA